MGEWFRKIRGLAGVGATWGGLWGLIGAGIGVVVGVVSPESWMFTNPVLEWAIGMGLYGVVSGIGFGSILSLREGRKSLFDLSLGRVAAWGVLGSIAVPLLFGALGTFEAGTTLFEILGAVAVTGILGGASAPAAVAVAKRAALQNSEEPEYLTAGS